MKLILDIETTVIFEEGNKMNPSPYDERNKLVSVQYKIVGGESHILFFNHDQATFEEMNINTRILQTLLDQATLVIGHNLKFDMSWLHECGFSYNGRFHDTMIFEYIAAKGRKPILKLGDCAIRYGLTPKKDILMEYLKQKINTNAIPRSELEEYGLGDIETTYQLYLKQGERYKAEADIKTMYPAMSMTNEVMACLTDIERAGIAIDMAELDRVGKEYLKEKLELEQKLTDMARSVMGDTPVNLASPADMSMVVYSRKVKDKNDWKETFNLGSEIRGAVKKQKYAKKFSPYQFDALVREKSERVYRTEAHHCTACNGKGSYFKKKKDGSDFARATTCPTCEGHKVVYISTNKAAGFRVKPLSSEYATVNGFSTDKETINDLVDAGGLNADAQVFLLGLQRLSALDTYLTSFVEGIRKGVKDDGLCHPNFNQCITATGRLSSSGPNFQNFPRGSTFPIRKVFVSRWAATGGKLIATDFAALEYRVAVMLADCDAGIKSILENKDRHQLSAEVMFGIKKEDTDPEQWKEYRQDAKKHTFAPLYGGGNASPKLKAYRDAFFQEHTGIAAWHDRLVNEALTTKQVVIPSGRIFEFPDVKRFGPDRVSGKTQIVNYPVQSFATADIVWVVILDLWYKMKDHKVKSKIIMQTHDDVVVDVHPDEIELMTMLINDSFKNANFLLTKRFKYDTRVPIGYEMSIGNNLMDKTVIMKG